MPKNTNNTRELWLQPPYEQQEVSEALTMFPGDVMHLMPEYRSVEVEDKWRELQREWFFKGLPKNLQLYPKDGIDPEKAFRHIQCIQGSFQPKHEHKEEAVAFLLGHWFDDYDIKGTDD